MKNEKRRLYLLVNDYDYKLFKDLFKLLKQQEKDFTEAHLFGAMLYQFCAVSERIYQNLQNEKENKKDER